MARGKWIEILPFAPSETQTEGDKKINGILSIFKKLRELKEECEDTTMIVEELKESLWAFAGWLSIVSKEIGDIGRKKKKKQSTLGPYKSETDEPERKRRDNN